MELITEYQQQQVWRNWEKYLNIIPLNNTDVVLDLGCSVGAVSHLFAKQVSKVIGVDNNPDFIRFCNEHKSSNEQFICSDFLALNLEELPQLGGVWGSFSLSYLAEPKKFLQKLYNKIHPAGWISLLDVSCFISGNMDKNSHYYQKVRSFELASYQSGIYDFNFGSKLEHLLESSGFNVIYKDNNVHDDELNFSGSATQDVVEVWHSRLDRLVKLQQILGKDYPHFKQQFLANVSSESHQQRQNLRYVVAIKE